MVNVPDSADHNALANRVSGLENDRTQLSQVLSVHAGMMADLSARVSKLEQAPLPPPPPPPPPDPEPEPTPTPPPPTGRLLHKSDLIYVGAFRLPSGTGNDPANYYEYGGTGLSYNPANDSLFIVGHDHGQKIGEVKVPEIRNTSLSGLARGQALQPLTSVQPPSNPLSGNIKTGGTLAADGQLVFTKYIYFDASNSARVSHGKLSSTSLTSQASGLYTVGNIGSGLVAGYMGVIPPEWQGRMGGRFLTGQATIPIISRTSAGPCAVIFDPKTFGSNAAPISPLVYYPYPDHEIAASDTTNPVYNTASEIKGIVWPDNTDSLLFFGSHGTGQWWYGEPGVDGSDPYRGSKGPHAAPYTYQVWAYDAKELEKVKNGTLAPWAVRPYDIWTFSTPIQSGACWAGGAAWDAIHRRVFFSAMYAGPNGEPVIHVYQVQ